MDLRRLLRDALNIHPGEGLPIALLGAYSFLIGIFLALFISLANASFLAEFGVGYLPHGYIVTGVVGYLAGATLSQLQRHLPLRRLLYCALAPALVLTVVYRVGAAFVPAHWLAFAMFVSIGPFITLLYFILRSLVGCLFDLRQGKRLFGLISSGDVVSSMIGFFSVPLLIRFFDDVSDLLPLGAAALVGCFFVLHQIGRRYAEQLGKADFDEGQVETGSFAELARQRYFVWLFLLSAATIVGFYYIDYAFLGQLRVRFEDKAYLAQFISVFYGIIRIIELVFKTFLSGRLLGQYGLRFGLVSMPALLLACVGLAWVANLLTGASMTLLFLLMAFAKLIERVLTKSLYDPSFNSLYQPINPGLRLAVQTKAEGIVQQLAVALAGGTLLLLGRYGSLDWVLTVLVLLMAAWLGAAVLMYREYRLTLLRNLAGQRLGGVDNSASDASSVDNSASDASSVELLAETLGEEEEGPCRRALGLYERLAPGRAGAAAVRLLRHNLPAVRCDALGVVGRVGAPALRPSVEHLAAEDPDDAVRLKAVEVLQGLPGAGDDIAVLAVSPSATDRARGARLSIGAGERAKDWLEMLAIDPDIAVRRAALAATDAESGSEKLWQVAVEALADPRLAPAAAAALGVGGEAALAELEEQAPALDARGVGRAARIYGEIGGGRAHALLLDKLAYPDKGVRANVLSALRHADYRASADEASRFRQLVADEVAAAAWAMAGIIDLGEGAGRVRRALGEELDTRRERVFLLLGLLYEPRYIRLVRDSFRSGSADGKVYALELIDVFLDQELRAFVFPLLEELPLAGRLRRLEAECPQQFLEQTERLKNIVNADPALCDRWTKACALEELGRQGAVLDEQVAHMFNPEPLLLQTAAWSVYRNSRVAYERAVSFLAYPVRGALGAALALGEEEGGLLTERVRLLKSSDLLRAVPENLLVDLAAQLRRIGEGTEGQPDRGDLYLVCGPEGQARWVGGLGGELPVGPPADNGDGPLFAVGRHGLDDLAANHLAAAAALVQGGGALPAAQGAHLPSNPATR
ncbi:MAG: hypothetical protein HN712_02105 [Gemmatimonadetes bacterium]|jgi:ATP:ADP antiporter, AAA family|nr:hypothetical protein [Gemmatimonadota bacterium]